MKTLLHQLECCDGIHRCVIEDNGRVAYAYLIRENQMIGDLWLYNQFPTPDEPEWRDRTKMPFLNPAAYVNTDTMSAPIESPEELAAEWELGNDGLAIRVSLFVRGRLYGVLAPASKPGWCVAALKDGPLAKHLCTMN